MKKNLDMGIIRLNGSFPIRCLIALARVTGFLLPFRNSSSLFFFFPFMHVGGAEKVHADVARCFAEEKPWVFFTKKSENDKFRSLFPPGARLLDFWPLLKYGYPLSVGVMAGFINRHENPVVFGSNSLFFYLMIPYLAPHVRRIDLLHAFGGGAEHFSLAAVPRLDARVVISGRMLTELERLYRDQGVEPSLLKRVVTIENMVRLPDRLPEKGKGDNLKVIYVGRGTEEKRVHLVGRAAGRCRSKGIAAEFILAGDLERAVEPQNRETCRFLGEVADPSAMARFYAEADVLLITSSREGFPLSVMEAMAHGVVPVCTRVGEIEQHLFHGINGMVVENGTEDEIVDGVVAALEILSQDRRLLGTLSRAAFEHAQTSFGPDKFRKAYRDLLKSR